jgi:hypothetical protein
MALLGLLILPSNYRAGAESAHPHSLIQLWADATKGTVRHHIDHGMAHGNPSFSSSWFDPAVGNTGPTQAMDLGDERPDSMEHQESTPVPSGVHLLLAGMMAIVSFGVCQPPVAAPDQRHSGLSPRVHVPPPRWTLAA